MATVQTDDEIRDILMRFEGEEIATLQVLGINSLKSLSPRPEAVAGDLIESISLAGRLITVTTSSHQVVFDLQRTGRLVWLWEAKPYVVTAGSSRPTVRLLCTSGHGLDLTEPAKTKRITVNLATRAAGGA